jgi:hypothetical protein
MHAPTEFCARIESVSGDTLGDFMSNIRVWLDRHRIDLVGFHPIPVTHGILAFDAYFRSEQHTVLFRHQFGRRHVSQTPLQNGEGETPRD